MEERTPELVQVVLMGQLVRFNIGLCHHYESVELERECSVDKSGKGKINDNCFGFKTFEKFIHQIFTYAQCFSIVIR